MAIRSNSNRAAARSCFAISAVSVSRHFRRAATDSGLVFPRPARSAATGQGALRDGSCATPAWCSGSSHAGSVISLKNSRRWWSTVASRLSSAICSGPLHGCAAKVADRLGHLVGRREHADEPCDRPGEQDFRFREGKLVVDRSARLVAQLTVLRDRVAGRIHRAGTSPVLEIGHQSADIVRSPRFIGRYPTQHLVKLIARGRGVNARHRRLVLEPPPGTHHGPQPALGRILPIDHVVQGLTKVIGRALSEAKPTHICLGLRHQRGRCAKATKHLLRPRTQLSPETLDHHSGQARDQLIVRHIAHRTSVRVQTRKRGSTTREHRRPMHLPRHDRAFAASRALQISQLC